MQNMVEREILQAFFYNRKFPLETASLPTFQKVGTGSAYSSPSKEPTCATTGYVVKSNHKGQWS